MHVCSTRNILVYGAITCVSHFMLSLRAKNAERVNASDKQLRRPSSVNLHRDVRTSLFVKRRPRSRYHVEDIVGDFDYAMAPVLRPFVVKRVSFIALTNDNGKLAT